MSANFEMQIRQLSKERLTNAASYLLLELEASEGIQAKVLPEEVRAAFEGDMALLREVADQVGVNLASTRANPNAEVDTLLAVSEASPSAKSALMRAVEKQETDRATLPVLGGIETLIIAIAVAIIRPKLVYEKKGEQTKLQISAEGHRDIAKIIRAVAGLGPPTPPSA